MNADIFAVLSKDKVLGGGIGLSWIRTICWKDRKWRSLIAEWYKSIERTSKVTNYPCLFDSKGMLFYEYYALGRSWFMR